MTHDAAGLLGIALVVFGFPKSAADSIAVAIVFGK